ncbi:hypothetical protein AB0O68_32765 [Streptomyces sp. NPDC087512]|uniref:hypothetical protein n=1 Tax=Streptomyces sp. NPDC087512 TaxID=3155059 RepID=UPI00342596E2
MTKKAPVGGPADSLEDGHMGVGGTALGHGTRASRDRALRTARDAVAAWSHAALGPGRPDYEGFPYEQVVGYYQQVGKAAVSGELVALLRGTRLGIECAGRARPWSAPEAWLLDTWLPLTFTDRPMSYASYSGNDVLTLAQWDTDGAPGATERAEDLLLAVLLADLVERETEALAATGGEGRQRTRTVAVWQALARLADWAPLALPDTAPLDGLRDALAAPGAEGAADAATAAAAAVRAEAPQALRRAVEVTLLPMTTLHDERMFIRSIQLFERIFARVARALTLAVEAVRDERPLDAAAFLESAADRLPDATAKLYRILTTMPPEAFAVIRNHTHGASAIQSRPYQLVETVSAKREAGAHAPEKGPVFALDATLQEAFLTRAGGWATADTRRLEEAMRRLDAGWCGMKRTHWGVTMKIIGRVSGTGGTTGADYLKAAAGVGLFPLLAAG